MILCSLLTCEWLSPKIPIEFILSTSFTKLFLLLDSLFNLFKSKVFSNLVDECFTEYLSFSSVNITFLLSIFSKEFNDNWLLEEFFLSTDWVKGLDKIKFSLSSFLFFLF